MPPIESEIQNPPASAWIRFLRSYGPTPNNVSLFDEHVSAAQTRAKVAPLKLPSPYLEAMLQHVQSGALGSMIIAGTAGDGKTYHCRSLWTAFGGDSKHWAQPTHIKRLTIADGRTAVFVKDLSELDDAESDQVLLLLERSVLENENSEFLVVASNHGQILERLRALGQRQGRTHPLRTAIQSAFLSSSSSLPRLEIFDLSKTSHRESLRAVLAAVAHHPEWDKCNGCALNTAERRCPIYENRNRVIGQGDGERLVARLGDLVEVANLNGAHLPVRDLLALTANIILGNDQAREGLMHCVDVSDIQEHGLESANIYSNIFGENLSRRAMERPVFRALSAFGIGDETSNNIDGLLVYGNDDPKLRDAFDRLIKIDPLYGATPRFLAAQQRYLEGEEGARLDDGAEHFLKKLAEQRRRLFFTLADVDAEYPYWHMSAFRFAGDYLNLLSALRDKRPFPEFIRERIIRGLNRVMTGLLLENADKLFVASSGGFTQSKISVLCDAEVPSRRVMGVGVQFKLDGHVEMPCLDVTISPDPQKRVVFTLTPVRFEFLCRVADGALPGSFSNECLEDMLAFKAKLLRQVELVRTQRSIDDEAEPESMGVSVQLNFIEIEQNGHGFSRPVVVRVFE